MAATKTVAHRLRSRKSRVPEILAANPKLSIKPRFGVVTLFGFGIQVRVARGHLILEDGIGADRRYARFARVGHGLKRLVVIGADGIVSLAALRWLADQDAAFVMLERDGSVLATTGPVRNTDARLRRAQALAVQSGIGLNITRHLITEKLLGQEKVARNQLRNAEAADTIAEFRSAIPKVTEVDAIRFLESQAALAYWGAWRNLPINFPKQDLPRVPDHWKTFDARTSPLTHSPRLAANPPNAILNYLYAILEAEAQLAVGAMGLDPGIGFLHVDTRRRYSLAADLMEPVRPKVDAFVLDWISREPFKQDWFFEERDGNCRLMAQFANRLSETADTWRREVAPLVEYVARAMWSTTPRSQKNTPPGTHLTQERRREVKGSEVPIASPPSPERLCRICGKPLRRGSQFCKECARVTSSEQMLEKAKLGRVASHGDESEAKRSAAQSKHAKALKQWDPATQPLLLTEEFYCTEIRPLLKNSTRLEIAATINVSIPYAADLRHGEKIPHPRHWAALAKLVGVPIE